MTIAEVMDMPATQAGPDEIALELRRLNQKMDRVVGILDGLERRVEAVEELREDLWPTVQGVAGQVMTKLHDLERRGAVDFVKEGIRTVEITATSFTDEDVRLLGENIVTILRTVRNLTQPEVMGVADRVAVALRDTDGRPGRGVGLFRTMRDPEVRRGMGVMLAVLRELGHEESERQNVPATVAG